MNQIYAHAGDVAAVFLLHLLIIFTILTLSDGRYLRPAEHGLTYQNSSTTPPMTRDNNMPQQQQQQMSSFFNGGIPVQSNLPLPEAKNITTDTTDGGVDVVNDDRWKRRIRSREDRGSRDHLKEVLLVASLVCGVAGVTFLVVSGVIFLSRCRKERSDSESQSTSTLALTGGAVGVTNKL